MTEELAAQGFEIVTDENGQELVKLMFMDENNESSGYALVSPEDATKIMNGEATLQNVIDEEGKQVLTLVPIEPEATAVGVSIGYKCKPGHCSISLSICFAIHFFTLDTMHAPIYFYKSNSLTTVFYSFL